MAKRLIFTNKAFADIDRIVEFNNNRNQSEVYSKKFVSGLNKRLKALLKNPSAGIATDMPGIMVLIWDDYYIFYTIYPLTLEVISIYHQKENTGL
jgi:plasmid stabilization system protein ParE